MLKIWKFVDDKPQSTSAEPVRLLNLSRPCSFFCRFHVMKQPAGELVFGLFSFCLWWNRLVDVCALLSWSICHWQYSSEYSCWQTCMGWKCHVVMLAVGDRGDSFQCFPYTCMSLSCLSWFLLSPAWSLHHLFSNICSINTCSIDRPTSQKKLLLNSWTRSLQDLHLPATARPPPSPTVTNRSWSLSVVWVR